MKPFIRWIVNVLVGLDQLGTAIVGGYPDETLSSYAHRLYMQGKPMGWTRYVINWLFFWQDDHCYEAYLWERVRAQLPPELR